jgi:hypothetical protein
VEIVLQRAMLDDSKFTLKFQQAAELASPLGYL